MTRFPRIGAPRAGLVAAVGAVLAGPAAVPALVPVVSGCAPSEPPPESVPLTGVRTVVAEQADGSYLIDSEELVEGEGELVVVRRDSVSGAETRETVRDPAQFASLLPASPPDSLVATDAQLSGAAASWGDEPAKAPADPAAVAQHRRGFPLGHLLLGTLLYQAWRPAGYGGARYAAPPAAYTGRQTERERAGTSSGFVAARSRGTLATPSRIQQARSVRASAPSGGRSGAFSRGLGRSGGG